MTTDRTEHQVWSAEDWLREGLYFRGGEERLQAVAVLMPIVMEWYHVDFFPPLELVLAYEAALRQRMAGSDFDAKLALLLCGDRGGWSFRSAVARACQAAAAPETRARVQARGLYLLTRDLGLPGTLQAHVGDLFRRLRDAHELNAVLAVPPRRRSPPLGTPQLDALRLRLDLLREDEVVDFLAKSLGKPAAEDEAATEKRAEVVAALRSVLEQRAAETRIAGREEWQRVLREVESGAYLSAAFLRLLPLLKLEPPGGSSQALPVGGYSDLSNRGPFDRLLISELAYPEEEFLRRFAEGEQLYYDLESPPPRVPAAECILLDGSPMTWGIARLAGQAATLALVESGRAGGKSVQVFGAADPLREFAGLDTRDGVRQLLAHQRWAAHLDRPLAAALARGAELGRATPAGADLIVCTEAGRVGEIRRAARAAEARAGVRLHVFAVDCVTGTARLLRLRDIGHDEVFRLELHPQEVAPARTRPPAEARASVQAGGFPQRPECQWGHGSTVTCASLDGDSRCVTGHRNGDVQLWDARVGARIARIARLGEYVNAVCIGGDRVLASAASGLKSVLLADGSVTTVSAEKPCNAWTLRRGSRPGEFVWVDPRGNLYWHDSGRGATETHGPCSMSRLWFVVDRRTGGAVYWSKDNEVGLACPTWARGPDPAGGDDWRLRLSRPLLDSVGTVFDEEGEVFLHRAEDRLELRCWADDQPEPRGEDGEAHRWQRPFGTVLETRKNPIAVNRAAQRVLCVNGATLWFWDTAAGTMIARRPPGKPLPPPRVATVGSGRRILGVDFKVKAQMRMRLSWEGALRVEYIPGPLLGGEASARLSLGPGKPGIVLCRGQMDADYHAALALAEEIVAQGRALDLLALNTLILASREGHDHEFWVPGHRGPAAWFYCNGGDRWAVVCADGLAAGSHLGLAAVRLPAGRQLKADPAGVAARFRTWAGCET